MEIVCQFLNDLVPIKKSREEIIKSNKLNLISIASEKTVKPDPIGSNQILSDPATDISLNYSDSVWLPE